MTVAVIGHLGVIGSAQQRMLENAGHDVIGFDLADGRTYPHGQIAGCDYAVVCVPTPADPWNGYADLTSVYRAILDLPDGVPVLLRSTVPPGTTDRLIELRPGLTAFWPEFMYERRGGAWSESTDVPYMILGGSPAARAFFRPRLEAIHPGKLHECSTVEAELAKYTINLYWATKVTFVNEMAAIAASYGADWENVRDAWIMDPRVNPDYTQMAGFPPGFGGRCWPKDLAALLGHVAGHDPQFLQAVQDANERFTARPGHAWRPYPQDPSVSWCMWCHVLSEWAGPVPGRCPGAPSFTEGPE